MRRLDRAFERLATRGHRSDPETVIDRLERRLAGEAEVIVLSGRNGIETMQTPRRSRGPMIAVGATAVALLVAVPILWLRGGDESPIAEDTSPTATTEAAPATTAPTTTAATVTTAATAVSPEVQTAIAWERVPDQASFAGRGDGAELWTVAEFDGRLYAGGFVVRPGTRYEGQLTDAAVWTSENARDWRLVTVWEDPDGLGVITQLIAGPEILIAAAQKHVWVSSDGETWSEVADPGTPSGTWLPVPDGWIVVVGEYPAEHAEVWLVSPDGTDWRAAEVVGLPGADPGRATRTLDAVQTDAGFVAVGFDEAGSHFVNGGNSVCGAIWFSETGAVWRQLDARSLCEDETLLNRIWVTPAGELVAQGLDSWWSSADPADPDSWHSIPDPALNPGPVLNLDAAIGDVGLLLPERNVNVWNLTGIGGDGLCVSDDGGATCLDLDTASGPFATSWGGPADGLVFGDEFVIVGSESTSGAIVGDAAVWIGTVNGSD